jgi:purine-cytosine permease-like protein
VVATITTNFVNIYMSSLAWKSLMPRAADASVIWSIGIVGTALSALPGVWLQQYTNFMVVLGAVLVPVGGVLIAYYYFRAPAFDDEEITAALYETDGRYRGTSAAGVAAWAAGAAVYFLSTSIGGTVPAVMVSVVLYLLLSRREGPAAGRRTRRAEPV